MLKWFFLKWKKKSNLLWNICKKNCKYSNVKKEAFYLIVNVLIPRVVHLYCSTSLFIFLFLLHFIAWFHKRRGGANPWWYTFLYVNLRNTFAATERGGGGAHLLLSKQNRQLIIDNIYYIISQRDVSGWNWYAIWRLLMLIKWASNVIKIRNLRLWLSCNFTQ